MSKPYIVRTTHILKVEVEVEAESEDQAMDIVDDMSADEIAESAYAWDTTDWEVRRG